MNPKKNTILLVGGGTGGHAAPILAIYQKLKSINPRLDITVVGNGGAEEANFFNSIPKYKKIKTGKFHRYLTLRNIVELFLFVVGFFQSLYIVNKVKPKVVFSKGGYVSLPIIYAARLSKIPYFIHESDIEMGQTNKILAKGASKIFVSFPVESYKGIVDNSKLVQSGPILRAGFNESKRAEGKLFGFENNNPVIFLTGGSQGSLNMSCNFIKIVPKLLDKYNIIHQAGKHSIEIVKKFYDNLNYDLKKNYYVTDFLKIDSKRDMMLEAINLADLVISRASSTIIELSAREKPMLLVPWKHAASNHQSLNAQFFKDRRAAVVLSDDEFIPDNIKLTIEKLFANNEEELKNLSKNAAKLFPLNGSDVICENLIKELEVK